MKRITATVDADEWRENKRWKEINRRDRNCRLVAILHEQAGRIDLVRLTSPHERIESGLQVDYPRWRQRQIVVPALGSDGDDLLIDLTWVTPGAIRLRFHACGYEWDYTGSSGYRTTCPRCHITVYIDKCRRG